MTDGGDAILIQPNDQGDKRGFIQSFRDDFIYPFQKSRFLNQWANAPIGLRFRLTNKCNENCARCFECSGPNNPLNAVSADDVAFYGNVPGMKFTDIYMTGGEWSLIYDVQPHYMRRIFDKLDLSKSDEYILQTNARWINGAHSSKILNDIKYIQSKLGKQNRILKLDMSVDRYRSAQSIDAVRDVICAVAGDPDFKHTKIRIISCALDAEMTNERVLIPEYFDAHGIKLTFEPRVWYNMYFQVCHANDTRIVIHEEGPTMRIGRAKQNEIGYKIYYPQKQCVGMDPTNPKIDLSVREDGMIKWHNWYDWDIMVPYKDKNGKNKPIEQIRDELVQMAWRKLLRHNIKNTALNLLPIFGPMRELYIYKQMNKTYEENRKQFRFYTRCIKEL